MTERAEKFLATVSENPSLKEELMERLAGKELKEARPDSSLCQ